MDAGNNSGFGIQKYGRDWVRHNETKEVAWYKDIYKDNTPKGYSYIGEEYKGIKIDTYSAYESDAGTKHLAIKIGYKDPNSEESDSYNWIQTVERDNSGKPFVDYDSNSQSGKDNYPYYQDKYENQSSRNKNGYDIIYYDKPTEPSKNGAFNAELTIISNSKIANPTPGITLNYGFSVKNGIMTIDPIKVVFPSSYHKQILKQIK